MASKVQIANLALSVLGSAQVSDLDTETTKEANLVNTFWDQVVQEVLEDHTWDFAKEWSSLAEDAAYTMVDEKYEYAYTLPSGYIRMSKVENDDAGHVEYVRRGEHLLCNESPFKIEYIKEITDVSKYPPHFIMAVAGKLRIYLAIGLKKKGAKSVDWLGIYLNEILPEARQRDARQSRPTNDDAVKHTKDNDTWVTAAGG